MRRIFVKPLGQAMPASTIIRSIGLLMLCTFGSSVIAAEEATLFRGKTVTMIIGYAAGGGTDAFGRLTANFLARYLPGSPTVIVRNVPGADGITAMNYFVEQVASDGYSLTVNASTTADPLNWRKPQAHFDPTRFAVIGGAGRGGVLLVIRNDAEKRLHDKKMPPVIMGALSGLPRSGMQMTAWGIEYLDWNAKWVIGYRGTSDLMVALERGEIDMTSTGNLFHVQRLLATGKFKVLAQTGMLKNGIRIARPEFSDAPVFETELAEKIRDPAMRKAFEYWSANSSIDKWAALPPDPPPVMLEAYRNAYARMIADTEFVERGKAMSDDFEPLLAGEIEPLIRTVGTTPAAAIDGLGAMLRKQGLPTQ
jgi:tripartite-type tricarboxylate transporter receptor subunit TctC